MIADKVSPVEELEGRFHFISDNTLRRNIALVFQYTIFLIAILDEAGGENQVLQVQFQYTKTWLPKAHVRLNLVLTMYYRSIYEQGKPQVTT